MKVAFDTSVLVAGSVARHVHEARASHLVSSSQGREIRSNHDDARVGGNVGDTDGYSGRATNRSSGC
jgi:hypothetical protein